MTKNKYFYNFIKIKLILIQIIFILLLIKIKKIKTALCVIAKKENKYIKEFIDHYKNLGFNTVFLYDNNDIEGENFDIILKEYIKKKFVKIINFRGLIRPQQLAYNQCYNNNKYNYNWIAFYDVDEFLFFHKYKKINDFLSLSKFKNCSSLLINWKYYGDNNNIFYKPKPLKERFIKPFYFSKNYENIYYYAAAKSIVRGGLNITWEHFPHFLKDQNICTPNGTTIINPLSPPNYTIAFIKHYATKSTEEYAEKLLKGAVYSNNTLNKTYWVNMIKNYYFIFNKSNKDKIKLFEKKLNIKINYDFKLFSKKAKI